MNTLAAPKNSDIVEPCIGNYLNNSLTTLSMNELTEKVSGMLYEQIADTVYETLEETLGVFELVESRQKNKEGLSVTELYSPYFRSRREDNILEDLDYWVNTLKNPDYASNYFREDIDAQIRYSLERLLCIRVEQSVERALGGVSPAVIMDLERIVRDATSSSLNTDLNR
jgi:hypothetical protein